MLKTHNKYQLLGGKYWHPINNSSASNNTIEKLIFLNVSFILYIVYILLSAIKIIFILLYYI